MYHIFLGESNFCPKNRQRQLLQFLLRKKKEKKKESPHCCSLPKLTLTAFQFHDRSFVPHLGLAHLSSERTIYTRALTQ